MCANNKYAVCRTNQRARGLQRRVCKFCSVSVVQGVVIGSSRRLGQRRRSSHRRRPASHQIQIIWGRSVSIRAMWSLYHHTLAAHLAYAPVPYLHQDQRWLPPPITLPKMSIPYRTNSIAHLPPPPVPIVCIQIRTCTMCRCKMVPTCTTCTTCSERQLFKGLCV